MARGISPVEKLRQIWTPQREVDEVFARLDPATALDSQIREFFSRMVIKEGSVTLDLTDRVPEDLDIRWEIVHFEGTGRREATIWTVPREQRGS